jgi:hypothetical protein
MVYLKDHVWIDHSSIDVWLMHLWDSLPQPRARYVPSLFIVPIGHISESDPTDEEIDRFRDLFDDLPSRGTACPLETLIYVLNCGPKPGASGNHFCVLVFAPSHKAIYMLGRNIHKAHTNNDSTDWDSWQGPRIWSRVCKLMGWDSLPPMHLRTTDWRQNGYDCGPIACQVAQHILTIGLQVQITGQWKSPSMMTCYHLLRWRMAEQVHQTVMDGYKKYGTIRTSYGLQMGDRLGLGELGGWDGYQEELGQKLKEMPIIVLLHSVQQNLQQAMRKCRACHERVEEDRHIQASKEHPIPLRKESIKQAAQRRQNDALQGTWSTKNYVAGILEAVKPEESSLEDNIHLDGQDFDSLEDNYKYHPPTLRKAPFRKAPSIDPRQARIGRFPRPKQAPDLPLRPNLLGLRLPFKRRFDDYEGGPPLEDLTPIHDTHLQLRPNFMYICKQIMLTPAPFSLFKYYGYRLFPSFAQAFDLGEPILVKEHLCPVGLPDPPNSITDYITNASKGRLGQDIKIDDSLVVGAEELLDIADEEGDDSILLSGRSIEGQYVCVDLLRDAVEPQELAFSCDIDSVIWTTQKPRFNAPIDVYSTPVIRDQAPIWKNNHVQVELVYPQSEEDIAAIGGRSEWLTNVHSLSTLPHLLFGALQGSSAVEILLFFPRMMHKNPHRHFRVNRIPKEIQDYFWDQVLLPALSSVIPSTRSAYFPIDRSHSAFKLGSGKHSAKFSLAPEELVKMVKRMKAIVSRTFFSLET